MPGPYDDLRSWLEGFLRSLLATIAPAVSQMVEDDLTKPTSILAKESHEYIIQAQATYAADALLNATYGLAALHADLEYISSQIIDLKSDVLAAVGTPAQALDAPTWYAAPPTPPTIYDIANQVWHETYENMYANDGYYVSLPMSQIVAMSWYQLNERLGAEGIQHPTIPYFSLVASDPSMVGITHVNWTHNQLTVMPGVPDWSALLEDDTPLAFLLRTQPALDWVIGGPWTIMATGETVWLDANPSNAIKWWRFNVTTADLRLIYAALHPAAPGGASAGAPVWPGIAAASLGTPVALSDGLVVEGPLDGVLVNITGHPAGAGKYGFGDVDSWRYLGAILFISDNGQADWPVQMGPESGLICPRSMIRAASAIVRLNAAFSGTITPWTIVG